MTISIFQRIATDAGVLARANGRETMSNKDVRYATLLLMPGDLAKHADNEVQKAWDKYNASNADKPSKKRSAKST